MALHFTDQSVGSTSVVKKTCSRSGHRSRKGGRRPNNKLKSYRPQAMTTKDVVRVYL